jgi:hypothetical protein
MRLRPATAQQNPPGRGNCPENRRAVLPKKVKLAVKPGSVVDSHSSGPHIAVRLKPPTRKLGGTRQRLPIRCCSGWRLPRFTPLVGPGSKHVSALTTHRPADSSLWPYSSPHGGRALPVTLPCGARTFLYARHGQVALSGLFRAQRLPGQLRRGFYHVDTTHPGVLGITKNMTASSKACFCH